MPKQTVKISRITEKADCSFCPKRAIFRIVGMENVSLAIELCLGCATQIRFGLRRIEHGNR